MDVLGVGGANVDIHGRSTAPIVMRDSNPGTLHITAGGVTRNILENLARLGADVGLCSVVGDDAYGDMLRGGCTALGIDTALLKTRPQHRSSTYLSIMDDDGDMLVALSDMSVLKTLGPDFVQESLPAINAARLCVCDGNLSPAALECLVKGATVPLYCDPVSTAWAKGLLPWLPYFYALKPNLLEAEVLSGQAIRSPADLERAADAILNKGVQEVYISLGAEGIFYKSQNGPSLRRKSRVTPAIVNATGAGDAAMAGLLLGTLQGRSAAERLAMALAASLVALSSDETINPAMSVPILEMYIKEYVL